MGYLSGAVESGYTAASEILEKLDPQSLTEKEEAYLYKNKSLYVQNLNQKSGFSSFKIRNLFVVPSSIAIGIGIGFLISKFHLKR